MKVANYCHHCPWKCITPHLRAHSIKETEGAINRWLLTSTHRKQKKRLPKKTGRRQSTFLIQLCVSCKLSYCWHLTLGHPDGSSGIGTLNIDFYHHCLQTYLTLSGGLLKNVSHFMIYVSALRLPYEPLICGMFVKDCNTILSRYKYD